MSPQVKPLFGPNLQDCLRTALDTGAGIIVSMDADGQATHASNVG